MIHYYGQKITTDIPGLDKLLFGGLHLQCPSTAEIEGPLTIAIYGDKGTSKALLAIQMLHGITKSLRGYDIFCKVGGVSKQIEFIEPLFCSSDGTSNVSDMLIDMVISKCVNAIVENNASDKGEWKASEFANIMFKTNNSSINIPIDKDKLDMYIGEEILVYNSHTNALHLAMPQNRKDRNKDDDIPLFLRRYHEIRRYVNLIRRRNKGSGNLWDNFFDVIIYSAKDGDEAVFDKFDERLAENTFIPCLVVDRNLSDYKAANSELFERLRQRSVVAIYIYEDSLRPKQGMQFDLHIELRRKEDETTHYLFNQMSITKSTLQDTAMGWHIYKKRDYGIEVYPSSHVLLQKRRHMPKDVLFSQKPILAHTFQHFIEEKQDKDCRKEKSLIEFESCLEDTHYLEKKLHTLLETHESQKEKECPIDVLKAVLMPSSAKEGGRVTALIGLPNTYKRYLTHSSTFSASCNGRHTLNILLDKDDQIMNQKMLCPAHIYNSNMLRLAEDRISLCAGCYKNVHVSNIRMGCISPDEFFFYLIKQIEVSRKHAPISRIVIDDVQKIEFCFPILYNDGLFLTTLISICKDYQIDLFMLCDKKSKLVNALRAQADNVICTERTEAKQLNIYIERYAESTTYSRLWKCKIEQPLKLFYCDIVGTDRKFYLNERNVTNEEIFSMEDYWTTNE